MYIYHYDDRIFRPQPKYGHEPIIVTRASARPSAYPSVRNIQGHNLGLVAD